MLQSWLLTLTSTEYRKDSAYIVKATLQRQKIKFLRLSKDATFQRHITGLSYKDDTYVNLKDPCAKSSLLTELCPTYKNGERKAKLTTVSFFIHMFVLSYCLKLIYKAHPQTALTCLDLYS